MKPKQWFAVGALASASLAVSAQPAPDRPNPLDANATVPTETYKSAFDTYQRASGEPRPSPDKVWREANHEVARPGAHSGHAMPEAAASTAPAQPPSMDHSKHH